MTTQRTWRWLALFVAVDVVLVVVMLRHVSAGGDDAGTDAAPIGDPTAVVTSAPPAATAPAVPGLIEAADDLVVWGTRGSCEAGAQVTLDRLDGEVRDELTPGITELLRLDVNAGGDIYVVGADADCEPVELLLASGATEWEDPSGPIRRWYLTPAAATLTTPAGVVDPGCAPVTFVSEGTSGTVACADGTVRTSPDDGVTWQTVATLAGLSGVTSTDEGVLALAPTEGCAVAAHRVEDGTAVLLGCVSVEAAEGLALLTSTEGDDVALVGDVVLTSSDGTAWEPVG